QRMLRSWYEFGAGPGQHAEPAGATPPSIPKGNTYA
ncbi:MAG: hypothetical protein QOE77_4110, partial [Blastocatellia bacterium]|nr:hypothetical protein [Blastocatellia bacterium]